MKKTVTTFIVGLALSLSLVWPASMGVLSGRVGGVAPSSLLTGLVAYWKLDEASGNATDVLGGNNLTSVNSVGAATGKVGGSRDFTAASSNRLTHVDNAALSPGDTDFTVVCWVNLKTKDFQYVVSKVNGDAEYWILYTSGEDRFKFQVFGTAGYGTSTSINADTLGSPSASTWYFIVVWHDATANTVNIQINNGTANTATHTAGAYNSAADFSISHASGPANALVDEVGIWSRVLTAGERTTLYNGGSGITYPF